MDVSKAKIKIIIKEIAENHDCGMNAFIHKHTLKTIFIPSEFNYDLGDYEEFYQNDLKEIEENFHFILKLEPPNSTQSFSIMETFTNNLFDGQLKNSLINAINRRRPFANFNHIIHNSESKEDWFKHKTRELEKRVKLELEHKLPGHNKR